MTKLIKVLKQKRSQSARMTLTKMAAIHKTIISAVHKVIFSLLHNITLLTICIEPIRPTNSNARVHQVYKVFQDH